MERIQKTQPSGPHCITTVHFSDRLCPAEDSPRRVVKGAKGGSTAYAGKEIEIILPPEPADQSLIGGKCDSEWMWEIHPKSLAKLGVRSGIRVFLCRHQLEMD